MLGVFAAKAVAIGLAVLAVTGALLVRNDRAAFVLFGVAMVVPAADLHFSYWLFAYVAGLVLVGGLLRRDGVKVAVTRDNVIVRASGPGD